MRMYKAGTVLAVGSTSDLSWNNKMNTNQIKYVYDDLFAHSESLSGPRFILHQCNNKGGWGRGFVLELSKRWPEPERAYRNREEYPLGDFDIIKVEPETYVVNIIGQEGYGNSARTGIVYTKLDALEEAFLKLSTTLPQNAVVHCPKLGAGLAGGDWSEIEKLLPLIQRPVTVFVHEPNKPVGDRK